MHDADEAAVRTYRRAVALTEARTDEAAAINTLIEEAGNDPGVLDRASFQCESALAEEYPGEPTLVSAFKLIRSALEELDSRRRRPVDRKHLGSRRTNLR